MHFNEPKTQLPLPPPPPPTAHGSNEESKKVAANNWAYFAVRISTHNNNVFRRHTRLIQLNSLPFYTHYLILNLLQFQGKVKSSNNRRTKKKKKTNEI